MHRPSSVLQFLQDLINAQGGEMPQTYGVPVEEIERGIRSGVRKVNIDTDCRMVMTGQFRKVATQNPQQFDPRKFLTAAMDEMQTLCRDRFERFGTAGNAHQDLTEADLIAGGKHVLVAYIMKPKPGFDGFLATAAHVAVESAIGTNVDVSTTDDFTRGVDTLVYEIDEANELMKITYPVDLFDHNIIDGRAMICSFLTLAIANNQGMGDVEYAKMHDFYVPPAFLRLFDGPATTISDMWRVPGRPHVDGGFIVGTIIKPKLGLRPQPFADACYDFWLGGGFIKNDEPQGNQLFAPLKENIPLVADAMKRA